MDGGESSTASTQSTGEKPVDVASAQLEQSTERNEHPQQINGPPRPEPSVPCEACTLYSDSGRRHTLLKQSLCENHPHCYMEKRFIENNEATPNKWSSTRFLPRVVGLFTFTMTLVAIAVGFVISVGCPSCYAHQSSQVGLPDRFAISDSMRLPPTRWTGLGLFSTSAGLASLLVRFRYLQIRGICGEAFPSLLRPNRMSNVFGISSCVLLAITVAFPPSSSGSVLGLTQISLLALAVISAALYLLIQYCWIERTLLRSQIIGSESHKLRLFLLIVGGTLAIAALPLLLLRNELAPGGSDKSKLICTLLFMFEFGSMVHVVASISLTDFGSMPVNLTRLETLSKTTYVASTGVVPWYHSFEGVSRDCRCDTG